MSIVSSFSSCLKTISETYTILSVVESDKSIDIYCENSQRSIGIYNFFRAQLNLEFDGYQINVYGYKVDGR